MEKYKRKVECIMNKCTGIIEVRWDNKEGFKIARCPDCGRLFEPYLETRLKLIEIEELAKKEHEVQCPACGRWISIKATSCVCELEEERQ